jgi:hypothetical protein
MVGNKLSRTNGTETGRSIKSKIWMASPSSPTAKLQVKQHDLHARWDMPSWSALRNVEISPGSLNRWHRLSRHIFLSWFPEVFRVRIEWLWNLLLWLIALTSYQICEIWNSEMTIITRLETSRKLHMTDSPYCMHCNATLAMEFNWCL